MAEPNAKKGFLLRLPKPLLDELRRWASQDMRSINGQIEWILRDAIRQHGRTIEPPEGDAPKSDEAKSDGPKSDRDDPQASDES